MIFPSISTNDRPKRFLDAILQSIIETQLTNVLRMEKRCVYSPSISGGFSMKYPYSFETVRVEWVSTPEKMSEVVEEARKALWALHTEEKPLRSYLTMKRSPERLSDKIVIARIPFGLII